MDTHAFDVRAVMRKLADELVPGGKKEFENVLLVAMQHMLGTTVDMLCVMKE